METRITANRDTTETVTMTLVAYGALVDRAHYLDVVEYGSLECPHLWVRRQARGRRTVTVTVSRGVFDAAMQAASAFDNRRANGNEAALYNALQAATAAFAAAAVGGE